MRSEREVSRYPGPSLGHSSTSHHLRPNPRPFLNCPFLQLVLRHFLLPPRLLIYPSRHRHHALEGTVETRRRSLSEFEQIMRGTKPMVTYYRAEGEPYYYADRRSFLKEVKSGKLLTKQFIIKNARQDFKVEYEIFAPRSEAWRLDI